MDTARNGAIDLIAGLRRGLPVLWAAGVAATAFAQTPVPAADPATEMPPVPKRAWIIDPSLTVSGTFTDNASLRQTGKQSDLVTEISPGVTIRGNTARFKGYADYRLRGLVYADLSDEDDIQHALNAFGTLEAIDNWLYLDVSGIMARQQVSALGVHSPSGTSVNSNTTQSSTFRLAPYIKGRLGGYADYQARYSRSWARTDTGTRFDSNIEEWSGRLAGDTPLAKLGWALDGSLQRYDYSAGRQFENDRLNGVLTYRIDPQLTLTAKVGLESNDLATLDKESYTTTGFGFDWHPTERTTLAVFREKRFFGSGHNVSFSHRTPLSAIQFSDSRDISALPSQMSRVGMGSLYDLLFTQLASAFPDEKVRTDFIDKFFAANPAISPDTPVTADFLSSQASVERRQELSFLLRGVRNTFTLTFRRANNEKLSSLGTLPGEDFDTYSSITQKGVSLVWSHNLGPFSSLGMSLNYAKSAGWTGVSESDTTSRNITLTYATKLGPRTAASLAFRRATASGAVASDFSENAVVMTLTMHY